MADPHKAGAALAYGPAPALFVVAPHDDATPRPQMNVGDTGTAKVSFVDETGADVKVTSVDWTSSSGSVVIATPAPATPDQPPPDPATVTFTATAPGPAHLKAAAVSESGAPAEAAIEVMVIEPGKPAAGKIDVTVTPAKKAK